MFDGLFMLLSLSALMATASFLAGVLPLSFSLTQSQLKTVSTLGMGVLVGTSLLVIIPEGVETLYSANNVARRSVRRDVYTSAASDVRWVSNAQVAPRLLSSRDEVSEVEAINALPGPVLPGGSDSLGDLSSSKDPPKTPTRPGEIAALDAGESSVGGSGEHSHADEGAHHAWLGISLISGFILMYLIDTLPALRPPAPSQRMNIYSLSDLGSTATPSPGSSASDGSRAGFSTTLGLVIHAAADGIALGASSTQPSLSFIIFFAIMVHKAPAAFGLTSVLLKQGLSKRQARTHLVAFSLAAPCGAIVTWLLAAILGGAGEGVEAARSTKWWTGIILLFSGGTFLYVAMHTMQEEEGGHGSDESTPNGYLDSPSHRESSRQKPQKSLRLVLTAVVGMLLPLVTQIGHAG